MSPPYHQPQNHSSAVNGYVVAVLEFQARPSTSGLFRETITVQDESGKRAELVLSANVSGRGLNLTPDRLVIVEAGKRIEERVVFVRRRAAGDGRVVARAPRGVEAQVRNNGTLAEIHLKVDLGIANAGDRLGITVTGGENESTYLPIKIVRNTSGTDGR